VADTSPGTGALVVIADPEFRKEVREAARAEGLPLTEAGSVDEALAGWSDTIGVVLLDATLAGSAPPLLQRSREAGVPVRVAGRTDQVDEVVGLLESGARGFVALPQLPRAVIEEVKNALAREAERHLEETTGMGRAKKELQAVFDTFPSALFVVGPDLCIRRANRAALSLPGKGVLPNPVGSDLRVMLGERLSRAGSGLLAAAARGDSVAEFDLDIAAGFEAGRPGRVYHLRVFPAEAGKAESGLPVFPADAGESPSGGLGDGALVLVEDVTLSRREEAEHARHQSRTRSTSRSARYSAGRSFRSCVWSRTASRRRCSKGIWMRSSSPSTA
jgi:CheY-like chemotaxis protein